MNWFKKTRESFKKDDPQEILPKEITQTFGEILSLKTKKTIEALNTFADRYNDTLFTEVSFLKKEAVLIGLLTTCAIASQLPGMENPLKGTKPAMEATSLLLSQQGEISKETFLKIREGLLPFLQTLSVIPGAIFTAGLAMHAKNTIKGNLKTELEPT